MKALAVHPGADFSVSDVFFGQRAALASLGVEFDTFNLSNRIDDWYKFITSQWRRRGRPADWDRRAMSIVEASAALMTNVLWHDYDWLILWSAMYVPEQIVRDIKLKLRRSPRIALVLTESPYDDREQLKWAQWADVCWTNERSSVAVLRQACPRTYYLPHAYDPARHAPQGLMLADPAIAHHDAVFIGTMFQERIELLGAVDWRGLGCDFGLYGSVSLLPRRHALRRYLRGPVMPNDEATALYHRAAIGLNVHRTSIGFGTAVPRITGAESLNPRAYELAACGVFTLSDARAEGAELFGDAVPTFDGPDELAELTRYYLARPERRAALAAKLPGLVAGQTFAARGEQMLGQLAGVDEAYRYASA